jgi:hypothetical protein
MRRLQVLAIQMTSTAATYVRVAQVLARRGALLLFAAVAAAQTVDPVDEFIRGEMEREKIMDRAPSLENSRFRNGRDWTSGRVHLALALTQDDIVQ